ncbi:DUF1295 domain-containing protein [Rhizobium cauense]|uniref:isoprenylcysteine carboxylmethyltransferase family protein n=1 Tax=Rhizobium cauense TaxID=1166683 RepID=UPI001C6EC9A8|nr:isoprenylcysteine carboxylmethyltransferase family protein [Rhizobium cauense]MBW9113868.1 DUF1295 domain-containing protein [Rhizobium cauense]
MDSLLPTFILLAFAVRFVSLAVSTVNEIRLRALGSREIGRANTITLALSHAAYYVLATVEWLQNDTPVVTWIWHKCAAVLLSMVELVFVIRSLGYIWTVKLLIAPDHPHIKSGLYRISRHPNYFLNVLPELVGFAVALNSFWTLILGLPLLHDPAVYPDPTGRGGNECRR